MIIKKDCIFFFVLYITFQISSAQNNNVAYKWPSPQEFKVQNGLPDPFVKPDGTRVKLKKEWPEQRKYIIAMLEHYQYGTMPPVPEHVAVKETLSEDIYDGMAIRKLYTLTIQRNSNSLDLHFGLIMPKGEGPFPIIIKNDRYAPDPFNQDKYLSQTNGRSGIPEDALLEAIKRGYIYCAFNREDLGSDICELGKYEENRNNGVFLLYPEYNWGTIIAWAWGYKLIIDFIEKLDYVDIKKIVATGHSRGGKTAMAAGIFDERIAVTAPNSSGLGGTASHFYDELNTPGKPRGNTQIIASHINVASHWWSKEYYKIAGWEARAPFDAHFGKIVVAPRAFFNTHSYQDYYANPLGCWLTNEAAKKVYKWLGVENNIGMHFRTGSHAQNIIDWFALLDFCDLYFYSKPASSKYSDYNYKVINPYPWAQIPLFWDVPVN